MNNKNVAGNTPGKDERNRRLAEELRANLKRRKVAQRDRDSGSKRAEPAAVVEEPGEQ